VGVTPVSPCAGRGMPQPMVSRSPPFRMAPVERPQALVVIGASAGGVEALIELAKRLPADLAAPVLVVIHRAPTTPSVLANVLSRAGRLPVHDALDGEELRAGEIYLAPPDRHLLV